MEMKNIIPHKPSEVSESKVWYPSFNLDLKNIPQAKKWEVGRKCRLILDVELKSIRLDEDNGEVGFEVRRVGMIEANPKEELTKMVIKNINK